MTTPPNNELRRAEEVAYQISDLVGVNALTLGNLREIVSEIQANALRFGAKLVAPKCGNFPECGSEYCDGRDDAKTDLENAASALERKDGV